MEGEIVQGKTVREREENIYCRSGRDLEIQRYD